MNIILVRGIEANKHESIIKKNSGNNNNLDDKKEIANKAYVTKRVTYMRAV